MPVISLQQNPSLPLADAEDAVGRVDTHAEGLSQP
jgi:hypothetical protein